MTLTLTLDPAIRHTVVHHSSTSTYTPNFIQIEKNFLWTDGRTDVRTDGHFSTLILLGRLLEVDLKMSGAGTTCRHYSASDCEVIDVVWCPSLRLSLHAPRCWQSPAAWWELSVHGRCLLRQCISAVVQPHQHDLDSVASEDSLEQSCTPSIGTNTNDTLFHKIHYQLYKLLKVRECIYNFFKIIRTISSISNDWVKS